MRPVAAGDIIWLPASDGSFGGSMRAAPEDGVVFEDATSSLYVPASKLREHAAAVLALLADAPRKGKRP